MSLLEAQGDNVFPAHWSSAEFVSLQCLVLSPFSCRLKPEGRLLLEAAAISGL